MRLKFEREEIKDIILATFVISTIFSINNFQFELYLFLMLFPITFFSLFLKEITQKLMAYNFGYNSKFKLYPLSSILAVVFSPIGIKIASPGFTELHPFKFSDWKYKRKKISIEDEGKIVFTGLSVFLFLSALCLLLNIKLLKNIYAIILIFNLLPILPFDGTKILKWTFSAWAFLLFFSIILLIV